MVVNLVMVVWKCVSVDSGVECVMTTTTGVKWMLVLPVDSQATWVVSDETFYRVCISSTCYNVVTV